MSFWNTDKVERLKTLWEAGRSASDIAATIGAPSRNAVIAKVHRLGLTRDAETIRLNIRQGGRTARALQPRAPKPVKLRVATSGGRVYPLPDDKPMPPPKPELIAVAPRPWLTRRDFKDCAFPAGGEGADLLSCCNPTGGAMYCPEHLRMRGDKRSTLNLIGRGGRVPKWALS